MTVNQIDIEVVEEADLDELIKEDLQVDQKQKPLELPKTNHYVDNAKLYDELTTYIRKYKATPADQPKPRVPEYVGRCILLISQKLSTIPKFSRYSYREEMIGDAVENCLLYIRNFDGDSYKNPFGYITQIAYYAFIRRIAKEKRQQYIKAKKIFAAGITDEWVTQQDQDGDESYTNSYVEYLQQNSDFVKDFEEKLEAKRKKRVKTAKKPKEGIEALLEQDEEGETNE